MSVLTIALLSCLAATCVWLAWGGLSSQGRNTRRVAGEVERTADALFRDWPGKD